VPRDILGGFDATQLDEVYDSEAELPATASIGAISAVVDAQGKPTIYVYTTTGWNQALGSAAGAGTGGTPPASSTGGGVNGATVSYAVTASGHNIALINKRSAATASGMFGWQSMTRGDFVTTVAATGTGNTCWYNDGGGHNIWLVGYPVDPGSPWVVLTPTQFESDLAAAGLPVWGATTQVPDWMP
jgi:hypothetical protein